MKVTKFLTLKGFVAVNKALLFKLTFEEAGLLGELISECAYWESKGQLTEDDFFYSSLENIYKNTTFKKDKQAIMLKRLVKLNLIRIERLGSRGLRHIKLLEDNILDVISMDLEQFKNYELSCELSDLPNDESLNCRTIRFGVAEFKEAAINNNNITINKNKINKNKEKINKRSSNVDVDSAFNSSLKNVIKEEKEIKKATKNKLQAKMLEGSVPLNEITTEKLSDINNDEAQQRREARAEAAAERKAKELQAQRNRVMKARLHQAEKFYTDPLVLGLLEKFISQYQLRNNFLAEEAWELILEKTLNIPANILKESIEYSIMQGYKQIFPIRNESIDNTINHIVDKKALREFTPEEEAEYDKNLARNADGSYMEF